MFPPALSPTTGESLALSPAAQPLYCRGKLVSGSRCLTLATRLASRPNLQAAIHTKKESCVWADAGVAGGMECGPQKEDQGTRADAACAGQAFLWGASTAADAAGVGEVAKGIGAVREAWTLWRTNIALGRMFTMPKSILAANRASIVAAAGRTASDHGTSSLAVGAPLSIAADRPSSFWDMAKSVGSAFVPFSGFAEQGARTMKACNP